MFNGVLKAKCSVQDVTISKSSFSCSTNEAETIANKSFAVKSFDFYPVFRPKCLVKKLNIKGSIVNLAKVFLGGSNKTFDVILDIQAAVVYFKALYATFMSEGVWVESLMHGDDFDRQMMPYGSDMDYFLATGAMIYGVTTYGLQVFLSATPFRIQNWNTSYLSADDLLLNMETFIFYW